MAQATDNVITLNASAKGSNVIPFAPRQAAKQSQTSADHADAQTLRNVHSESLLALPFVTRPSDDIESWAEFWEQTNLWNDEPIDNAHIDYSRGEQYARAAVAAIIDDGAIAHDLILVVGRIVKSGFKRRGPAGRPCRSLSATAEGFIDQLCKIAVESSRVIANASAGRGLA